MHNAPSSITAQPFTLPNAPVFNANPRAPSSKPTPSPALSALNPRPHTSRNSSPLNATSLSRNAPIPARTDAHAPPPKTLIASSPRPSSSPIQQQPSTQPSAAPSTAPRSRQPRPALVASSNAGHHLSAGPPAPERQAAQIRRPIRPSDAAKLAPQAPSSPLFPEADALPISSAAVDRLPPRSILRRCPAPRQIHHLFSLDRVAPVARVFGLALIPFEPPLGFANKNGRKSEKNEDEWKMERGTSRSERR